jgi:hypothetical protein
MRKKEEAITRFLKTSLQKKKQLMKKVDLPETLRSMEFAENSLEKSKEETKWKRWLKKKDESNRIEQPLTPEESFKEVVAEEELALWEEDLLSINLIQNKNVKQTDLRFK